MVSTREDEAAIRRVIEQVHDAIWNKDFEAFARGHVQTDYARRWVWWLPSTVVIKEGWADIGARIAQVMADPLMPNGVDPSVRRENFNLRISGDMAWVTFDQSVATTSGRALGIAGYSRELRILERHDGAWKIAFFGGISRNLPAPDRPRFRVDREGAVLWKNEAAAAELETGTELTTRGGKLVARERKANQALQSAIRWVANLNLGFTIERGQVPILPEPGFDAPAKVWWVTLIAEAIEVTVHDRQLPDNRLALAASVYGLSPAQAKIAKGIVAGRGLPELAAEHGISLNTARTHLKRLFDKTGVRNQTALVRALLTVAAPD